MDKTLKEQDRRPYFCLGVSGGGNVTPEIYELARAVGREAALRGWVVVTGGLGGVMEGAARGACEAEGLTIGILPGGDRRQANPYIKIAVVTNMHHARNSIIAHTADALIAIDGEHGTLSEIALGLKLGKIVVGLRTSWTVSGLVPAADPKEAIEKVLSSIQKI
jgi:uncharacterized protein (TIGR00725 family)